MRVIIAGSRDIEYYEIVESAIRNSGFNITTVISGTARGVDRLGEEYAKKNDIPIERYPPDWIKWGKSAGYRRNERMADVADAAIIIWDGISKGSKHMFDIATRKGLKVYLYHVK